MKELCVDDARVDGVVGVNPAPGQALCELFRVESIRELRPAVCHPLVLCVWLVVVNFVPVPAGLWQPWSSIVRYRGQEDNATSVADHGLHQLRPRQ